MRKPRILMVEDEPTILKANAEYFEAQGYEVVTAASLSAAHAALQESLPDVILLDVMLGDGSGFDFCSAARRQTSAPILYLTALDGHEDEERGFALGGDDYVVKPYRLNILAARVAALLRRTGIASGGRLELPPPFRWTPKPGFASFPAGTSSFRKWSCGCCTFLWRTLASGWIGT